jgi:hypothetical protein
VFSDIVFIFFGLAEFLNSAGGFGRRDPQEGGRKVTTFRTEAVSLPAQGQVGFVLGLFWL